MSRVWVRQGLVEQCVYGEQGSNHFQWPIIRQPPTKITNRLQVFFMLGLVLFLYMKGKCCLDGRLLEQGVLLSGGVSV